MERFFINQKNNEHIVVGGVRFLAEFSRERIVLNVVGAQVLICGERLKIARFDENEICVTGKISNVETMNRVMRNTLPPSDQKGGAV